ncbi:MAG: XrtA system polysaccharide deacetylase [Candidatus Latescibacterota bacterium]
MSDRTPVNAFTVDWEDWYQGLEIDMDHWDGFADRLSVGTERLLALLADADVRATFFVLGRAAQSAPALLRKICDAGHEIGTHGYSHRFVYALGAEQFRSELRQSLSIIEDILGTRCVLGHRAPFFSIVKGTEWAFEIMREEGLQYDSSVFPVQNYRYGIPDAPRWPYEAHPGLVEFPPSTWRLAGRNIPVAGGAYFRIFPYNLTRSALRSINASGRSAAFYIHPWELDPDHPRLDLPRRVSLTHYWNLERTEARLRRLLHDFSFAPMVEVLGLGDTV